MAEAANSVPHSEGDVHAVTNLLVLLTQISELQPGEFKAFHERLDQLPLKIRDAVRQSWVEHWARTEPRAALAFGMGLRDSDVRTQLLREAAIPLARQDPGFLIQTLSAEKGLHPRILSAHAILPALASVDPARAVDYLHSHPEFQRRSHLYEAVAAEYARLAPDQARAWAESLEPDATRKAALEQVWDAWAQRQPEAAAAALAATEISMWNLKPFENISRRWSQTDPAACRDWIRSLPDPRAQAAAWESYQPKFSNLGAKEALEVVAGLPSAKHQTELATKFATELAKEDVNSAIAWAQQLPEGTARTQAMRRALDEWGSTDPAAAVAYASAEPDEKTRSELLRRATLAWAVQDPEAALASTRNLAPGDARDKAAAEAIRALRDFNPTGVLPWLDLIENSRTRGLAAQEIVAEWATQDGRAALEWVSKLPSDAQPGAAYEAVRGWAFSDPVGAEQQIQQMQSGPGRDSAIAAYVSVIDGVDVGLATKWALSIEQAERRNEVAASAFQRWLREDPDSARQWQQSAQLPEDLRQALGPPLQREDR